MNLKERIEVFARLGEKIKNLTSAEREDLYRKAGDQNPWFTAENTALALQGIAHMLEAEKLTQWTAHYTLNGKRKVGVAMAGNIPLVGFHDYLCVLISGHTIQIKLSSQDAVLLPELHRFLSEIDPRFEERATFEDRLHQYDAAIATGSDNTARYFSYYFRNVPHIIRKNRSSCGVLMGEESEKELMDLGKDVFSYFGLGCRNVSKLYVPEEYDFKLLLSTWENYAGVIQHHKYANNYDYQKSIHLVNQKPFFDNGSVLLMEDNRLVSPIGVLYYERYKDQDDLRKKIIQHKDKQQCIVSATGWFEGSIPFGKAQLPEVWDYSDNVDTLKFLDDLQ